VTADSLPAVAGDSRIPVTASTLARLLAGSLQGPDVLVRTLTAPACAQTDAVTAVFGARELETALRGTPGLLVCPDGLLPAGYSGPVIIVPDAQLALAQLSRFFDRRPPPASGRHASAVIAPDADVHDTVALGAFTTVGAGSSIGEGSSIGPGCSIHENVTIGRDCRIHANVTLYDGVMLGDRVILHSGCVIGADGFGFVRTVAGPQKVHQLGSVELADDVEIGANSAVDRATLGVTRIGARTRIDNLCQIGHNVTIGSDCLIAGQSAIGGSSTLGDGVTLGGGVGITDHVKIGSGAVLGGRSGVTKDVPANETWFGTPAMPWRQFARRSYLLGQLERIWRTVSGKEE
jgi:UDP-3-O-[3-hydroxymyristoyl] glucosamine N-acyltransferase